MKLKVNCNFGEGSCQFNRLNWKGFVHKFCQGVGGEENLLKLLSSDDNEAK